MTASATPRLDLPFLQAGQALKNITHNEALHRLDAGLYLACSNMAASALPAEPAEATALIMSGMAVPELSERIGQIGVYLAGRWVWFSPTAGWIIWDEESQTLRVYDGQEWIGPVLETVPEKLPLLGLNASASPTQRLSVASATSLFNHDGDSHRLTLNRAAEADTASLIFQTDFSGEAELGLAGAEGFTLKTSSDGINFVERMSTPANSSGISSPAFASQRVLVENDAAVLIETPSSGGIVAVTIVNDEGFPQVGHSGLLAYDTGGTPVLNSLAKINKLENHGTAVLNGTTSSDGNIGMSAVDGGLYLENRIPLSREFSLTFLC